MIERQTLPEISFYIIHTRQTATTYDDKASNRAKSGLTMTVNTGRLRQAINNLSQYGYSLYHEKQQYVSFIVVAALQE